MVTERKKLERLIRNSDLANLEKYVLHLQKIQKDILSFDDPSLVLLAIKVYLNPECISNTDYQLDVVIFLLKLGLTLFVPNGLVVIYLLDLGEKWGVSEEKMLDVFQTLVKFGNYNLFYYDIPSSIKLRYNSCMVYLERNWAAIKIQRFWQIICQNPSR